MVKNTFEVILNAKSGGQHFTTTYTAESIEEVLQLHNESPSRNVTIKCIHEFSKRGRYMQSHQINCSDEEFQELIRNIEDYIRNKDNPVQETRKGGRVREFFHNLSFAYIGFILFIVIMIGFTIYQAFFENYEIAMDETDILLSQELGVSLDDVNITKKDSEDAYLDHFFGNHNKYKRYKIQFEYEDYLLESRVTIGYWEDSKEIVNSELWINMYENEWYEIDDGKVYSHQKGIRSLTNISFP